MPNIEPPKKKPPFHEEIIKEMWRIINDDWRIAKADTAKGMTKEEKRDDSSHKWAVFPAYCSLLEGCFLPPDEIKKTIDELRKMAEKLMDTFITRYRENCYSGLFRTGPKILLKAARLLEEEQAEGK